MKREISIIVFWGALWGLFEATVGYSLHMLTISIGWLIWFPASYYFMSRAYKHSGKVYSMLYASFIAAAIKLVNFLLPVRIDMVLNPFASIIFEGLVVFVVYKTLEKHKDNILSYDFIKAILLSLSWRVLYLMYLLPLPGFIVDISPLRGIEPLMNFLFLQGISNAFVIYACIIMVKKFKELYAKTGNEKTSFTTVPKRILDSVYLHPMIPFSLLIFTVFIQWMI